MTRVDLSVAPELLDSVIFCDKHSRGHSDAAKRMADNLNVHFAANELGVWDAVGKWVAVRLEDGGSDGDAYDSKADAVRHQLDEFLCCYVRLRGVRFDPCECETYLDIHRRMYKAGMRLADPDARSGGRQLLLSNRAEDRRQVLAILRNARRG